MQDRTALVLYGTETGTSQDLAEEVCQILERLLFTTHVAGLDAVTPESLSAYTLTIIVIATTGQGDFPSNAKAFWTSLLRKKLGADYLSGVRYALIGLGDTSYPKFNWAGRKLEKRLRQLGAQEVIESCEADEQGDESTEGAFLAWTPALKDAVIQQFPLPVGTEPISESIPLPSKTILEQCPTEANGHVNDDSGGTDFRPFPSSEPDIDSRPIPYSIPARLESNTRVTPADHWQDVRHLTLNLATSASYLPGDVVAILPKNFHQDVTTLLQLMNWTDIADEPIQIKETSRLAGLESYQSQAGVPLKNITLRSLLSDYLDITAIPRRSFFSKLSKFTTDEMQRDRLIEFTEAQYLDEYYDYATRPRRSILEILQEFDSVKVPWKEAINIFPVMRPRQFSIASGGTIKRNSDGTTRFDLLVAIVKYRTVIKKIRQGVCTRYLASLPIGSTLNIALRSDGRLHTRPQDFTGSHILIGAGTGIAPLRSLVYEKDFIRSKIGADNSGPTTLIFGSRSKKADYFWKEEWETISSSSEPGEPPGEPSTRQQQRLTLHTAFSRDQTRKIYVQDRIRQHSTSLFQQIYNQNATIVVCGSSGAMPKAVRQALIDVLVDGLAGLAGLSKDKKEESGEDTTSLDRKKIVEEEAELYLSTMEKLGRFKQETW